MYGILLTHGLVYSVLEIAKLGFHQGMLMGVQIDIIEASILIQ